MYQVGDKIIYGGNGVCVIEEVKIIESPRTGDAQQYYVIRPLFQDCKISVPVDTTMFMRPVISADEAVALVDSIPGVEVEPYYNPALRQLQEYYDAKLNTHRCEDLIELTMSLHRKKLRTLEQKRKFGAIDERYMKRAEELLLGELSAALEIPRDDVRQYIEDRLTAKA